MDFRWNAWNQEHLADHDVYPDEAEEAVESARSPFPLVQGDRYLVWGRTQDGTPAGRLHPRPGGHYLRYSRAIVDGKGKEAISTENKMKTPAKKAGRNSTMNVAELREATAPYDAEMAIEGFARPAVKARQRWERARRKPGRPRRGKGAKVISVSVERALLSESDRLAKSLGVSRAGLIERGLKAVLAAEGRL